MQFTHDTIRMMGIHVWAVYCLLACAEQEGVVPVTRLWLLDHMPDKTSPNTVTGALRWLTSDERQVARRVTGGWRLNLENAIQLPLVYDLAEGEKRAERAFGDLIIINDSPINSESVNNNNKGEKRAERAFGDSRRFSCPARSDEQAAALEAALRDHQIIGKKKQELLDCEWVSADYVRAWVEFEKLERDPEHALGRAILKMLDHYPAPAMRENGHPENCTCAKCKVDDFMGRSKYTSGPYVDLINNEEESEDE